MLSVLGVLVFMLIFTISLFYAISTHERESNAKKELSTYSHLLSQYMKDVDYGNAKSVIDKYSDLGIRISVIAEDGEVIFDSVMNEDLLPNHINREEIIGATENGEYCVTRYSSTEKKTVIYYAVAMDNGLIIRTSRDVQNINKLEDTYLVWYSIAIVMIMTISFWISNKLSYVIVKPIRDLDSITSMIANGELSRRVKVTTNDELGQLASNFNHMASELEGSLNELSEKQNKLSAILQSMESGVIAIDNNRNIITINNYAKKIFNIKHDVVGKPVKHICNDIDFQDMFSMRDRDIQEFILRFPVRKILRVKTTDIIVNNHQHIGAVAVIQDITEFKKLENMRTEFVANVSHELKTPLTSIRGFAETLKDVDDEETKNKFLNIINEEAERLTRLISDILLLSQIEHKQEFKREVFDVNKVIEDVFYLMKNTSDKKQINIEIVGDNIPNILGDKDKFKQMIINLVDNAIKYSDNFDAVIITKKANDRDFSIIIEDTGMGIDESFIPRLFERFYRVDKARSRAKGGTGLGLAIVKHILIGFNGSINVESTLGVGTKFIINVPYNADK